MIARTDIINYLIWKQGYRSYLEIGLDDPEPNFTKIRCELKESVDPYDPSSNFCAAWTQEDLNRFLPYLTYRMTSDDFFAAYPDKKYKIDGKVHATHALRRESDRNGLGRGPNRIHR